jgi:hypothetical protein
MAFTTYKTVTAKYKTDGYTHKFDITERSETTRKFIFCARIF